MAPLLEDDDFVLSVLLDGIRLVLWAIPAVFVEPFSTVSMGVLAPIVVFLFAVSIVQASSFYWDGGGDLLSRVIGTTVAVGRLLAGSLVGLIVGVVLALVFANLVYPVAWVPVATLAYLWTHREELL